MNKTAEPSARLAAASTVLRIRVEVRANVTERAVMSRQLQLMQASVQPRPTEDLNTADTSCPSRTSAENFDDKPGPCPKN